MRDVLPDIERWRAEGEETIGLATVIETWGSAPRGVGSKMAFTSGDKISGSVSGGCVEAAVIEAGGEVLRDGKPRLLHFGVADDTAWAVGLSCGGTIEVFVERFDASLEEALRRALAQERTIAVTTVVRGGDDAIGRKLMLADDGAPVGSLGGALQATAAAATSEALERGSSQRVTLAAATGTDDAVEAFVEVILPPPTLVVVGGVHIAVALTALARTLGYRTAVVDPRQPFANEQRFPQADRVVRAWPDEALGEIGLGPATAVAVLTHDPKLDDPALRAALPSAAFYVGVLGSRATQAKRRQRLLDAGLTEAQLARLHAPIGLDLGGRKPEEIALSVMAQIVAARNGQDTRR
jgi:xanthine dehydrogenase accessory factor